MPQPSFAHASSVPVAHRSLGRPRRGRNCGWADAALSSAGPSEIEKDPVFSMDGRGLSRFGRALPPDRHGQRIARRTRRLPASAWRVRAPRVLLWSATLGPVSRRQRR